MPGEGSRCSTKVLERYQSSGKTLVPVLVEMYIEGPSTRKVKVITENLYGHSFSAVALSEVGKRVDGRLQEFATRPLVGPACVPDSGCPLREGA